MRRLAPVVLLFLLALPADAWAGWSEPVAGSLNVDPSLFATQPSLTMVGSTPHVAWEEDEIHVKRLNAGGTAWETVVGPVTNNPSNLTATSASIGAAGSTPYVVWDNESTQHDIRVKRVNTAGTAWEEPWGELTIGPFDGGRPTLAVVGSTPHVAWAQVHATGVGIRVKRLNLAGDDWEEPVAALLNVDAALDAVQPSIAAVGTTPYVAWREQNGVPVGQIRVKRLNPTGTAWEEPVPGSLNVDTAREANTPSIASVDGVPYVAWREEATAGGINQVRVKRLNANETAWEEVVPGSLNVEALDVPGFPSIAAIAGVPYVAWSEDAAVGSRVRVKRLNAAGTAWVEPAVGSLNFDPIREARVGGVSALADVSGTPFAAWHEPDATAVTQIRVKRFTPDPAGGGPGGSEPAAQLPSGPLAVAAASRLGVAPKAFPAAARGASITARRRRRTGTRVRYRLSADARVQFRVERRARGRRVRRRCVRPKRSNRRRPRCIRFVRVRGAFTHAGRAGQNSFRFTGRVRRRKLRPGRYRLVATPLAADGRRGRSVRTPFLIVR